MPEITIPGRADFVALVRLAVHVVLAGSPEEVRADGALIASEFVTNSILWSRSGRDGSVTLRIDHEPGSTTARIEVFDGGRLSESELAAAKEARALPDEEQFERGLVIIAELVKDWGHRSEDDCGTYWAVLSWA